MRRFVLIPGAGGSAWYWHRVVPLLESAGHEVVAVDLPAEDATAGLREYASLVAQAASEPPGAGDGVVLVAQSLGGFTAPMAAAQLADDLRLRGIVLVNAMVPVPGETPGAWWGNTGWEQAKRAAAKRGGYSEDFDENVYFLHDVPAEVLESGEPPRPEADAVFESPCEFSAWPQVPIRVAAGAEDRFFPAEFQQAVAQERLGVKADPLPGGHLITLSQPDALAGYLLQG